MLSSPQPELRVIPRLLIWARRAFCYTHANSYSTHARASISDAEVQSARAYCSGLLQKYDAPSFTLQTFVPPAARDAYLCVRAFNIDIARIADQVSTPLIGAMRMEFWRDTIAKTFSGSPPKEPVAILLSHVLLDLHDRTNGTARLSKTWFNRVINAREQYMNNPPYPSLEALETCAEHTYSTLLYLELQALPLASITVDHLASHIGKASGIVAVLRGLPLLAFPPAPNHHSNRTGLSGTAGGSRQGTVPLPLDIMAETRLKEEEVLRKGAEAPGLRDAVFKVATRANDHLITAREMLNNLYANGDAGHAFEHEHDDGHSYGITNTDEGERSKVGEVQRGFCFLMGPAVASGLWLQQLEQLDFDIFRPELRRRNWKLPWKAYMAYTRKRF